MKKLEIVWFLTKGGVPPPPPLLRFGTFPVFSFNFLLLLNDLLVVKHILYDMDVLPSPHIECINLY